jgi:Ca-activated chloride channel family protein
VKGLARASLGAAEFISPGERVEAKVMRQFTRVFTPAMTGVKVAWGQEGLTQASDRVPPVFDGERVRVYALGGDTIASGTATLRGTIAGRDVAFDIAIEPASAVEGDTIATLAARERIRMLEEEGEYLESRGSLQRRSRATSKAAAEIAALGVKYQLASRETSFVAVEHRDTPLEGRAELRRVPVALTSGWGGLRETGTHHLCAPQMFMAAPPVLSALRASFGATREQVWSDSDQDMPRASAAYPESDDMADDTACFSMDESAHGPRDRSVAPSGSFDQRVTRSRVQALRPLDVLVSLQRADGSWDLTAELAGFLSLTLRRLERELRHATGDRDTARRAWATALAVAWLEAHAAADRGEWDLLAGKAESFVSASGTEPAAGRGWSAWLDVARRLV